MSCFVSAGAYGEVVIDYDSVKVKVCDIDSVAKMLWENRKATPGVMEDPIADAGFPGGMRRFVQTVVNDKLGDMAANLPETRMKFEFTIEKDGHLDNIILLDDGGYPKVAARIVELLGQSPKCYPGIYYGKLVRTVFTFPFIIKNTSTTQTHL